MAVSQTPCLDVWVANAWGDLYLHRQITGKHTRLDRRGELRIEDRRPKRVFILDVLDDVSHFHQILPAYLVRHPLIEHRPNAGFAEIVEGLIPKVIECLGPIEARTRSRLHLEDPSREVHMEDLDNEM